MTQRHAALLLCGSGLAALLISPFLNLDAAHNLALVWLGLILLVWGLFVTMNRGDQM